MVGNIRRLVGFALLNTMLNWSKDLYYIGLFTKMMARKIINPDELANVYEDFNYNYVIVEDGTLYHSGQVGRDKNGNNITSSFESQARQAFKNVEIILDSVDKDFSDVNKLTTYLTNIGRDREIYRKVRDEILEKPYPAATMIGVDRLSYDELLIEIEIEVPVDETTLE